MYFEYLGSRKKKLQKLVLVIIYCATLQTYVVQ